MEIKCKINIPDARGMDSVKMPEFDIEGSCISYWIYQVQKEAIEAEKAITEAYELVRACTAPGIVSLVWQKEMMEECKRHTAAVSESTINMRTVRD